MNADALQAIITTLILAQMQNPNPTPLKPEYIKLEHITQKKQVVHNSKKKSREQKKHTYPSQQNKPTYQPFPKNFRRSR